jgi:hypothetical protein
MGEAAWWWNEGRSRYRAQGLHGMACPPGLQKLVCKPPLGSLSLLASEATPFGTLCPG